MENQRNYTQAVMKSVFRYVMLAVKMTVVSVQTAKTYRIWGLW